ncbi:MAG: ComF family protein, partial [Dehalococcoidia bacterium]
MRVLASLARILYPERCLGCGAFGALLCSRCREALPRIGTEGRCGHCRGRWREETFCPRCFAWLPVDGTVVACEMEGVARRLVHGLKYRGIEGCARLMAEGIDAAVPDTDPDWAVAVPLHRSRERRRGFNQADRLLRALGWRAMPEGLRRIRKTATQVGMREQERRRNVAGAFEYSGPSLDGCHVAVVDDVITTG